MTDRAPLTKAQREHNVERMRRVEADLGQAETDLAHAVFSAVRVHREVRRLREELRDVFGMEPLGPPAPLYVALAQEADKREELSGGD